MQFWELVRLSPWSPPISNDREGKMVKTNNRSRIGNLLLSSLPAAEWKRLESSFEVVHVEVEQRLAEFEKPIQYVWFPHDCITSTVVTADAGTFLEVGLMGAEGMVGLSLVLAEDVSNTTVIVQVPGDATRMDAKDFKSEVLSERGPFVQLIQRYCNAFMSMIAQSAVCNTTHPLDERMCRWLLMTHDRIRQDRMQLAHKFLAMMLGVPQPTVATTASVLKQAGLIDCTLDTVTVLDRKGLEQSACECYAIITRQLETVFSPEWRENARR